MNSVKINRERDLRRGSEVRPGTDPLSIIPKNFTEDPEFASINIESPSSIFTRVSPDASPEKRSRKKLIGRKSLLLAPRRMSVLNLENGTGILTGSPLGKSI